MPSTKDDVILTRKKKNFIDKGLHTTLERNYIESNYMRLNYTNRKLHREDIISKNNYTEKYYMERYYEGRYYTEGKSYTKITHESFQLY